MSALSPTEQELFDVARAALPSWMFSDDNNVQEIIAEFAKQFAATKGQLDFYVDQVFILRAVGVFLDDHAKDLGTRRQLNEADDALAQRLRTVADTLTIAAIRATVTDLLTNYSITIPAGYPGIFEWRRDRAFYSAGRGVQVNCVAVASLVDGETFDLGGLVYEFDVTGDGVTPGNVQVDVSSLTTAAQVATKVSAVILAQVPAADIRTTSQYVVLRSIEGEVSDTVADAGFSIFRKKAYFSNGYRMGESMSVLLITLPYGSGTDVQAAIEEALRQIKAAGITIIVERRLSP